MVAKDARKKAAREYRVAMNEYQPIAVKHEEQEKAVTTFVQSAKVHLYMYMYINNLCIHCICIHVHVRIYMHCMYGGVFWPSYMYMYIYTMLPW